ncbi:MAG: iron-sulfur cluster assembly protein [Pseudomonadota bacterium]
MEKELLEGDINKALAEIIDPETHLSIMRMGIIKGVSIDEDGAVNLIFRPSSPTCPMAYSLAGSIKNKIESLPGVKSLFISVENFSRAKHLEEIVNV